MSLASNSRTSKRQGSYGMEERTSESFQRQVVVSKPDAIGRLTGPKDENLQVLEERFPVTLNLRGEIITVQGPDEKVVETIADFLEQALEVAQKGQIITPTDIRYAMDTIAEEGTVDLSHMFSEMIITTARGKPVRARTAGQQSYIQAMKTNDIVFAIGPAGTGKTYLAVCNAVSMLKESKISRIILVRPVVEAGESLGYLPGDLREKVEPYVRPLYDAFYDLFSPERFMRYVEKNIIEIAPLAYMRGRTLNDSFIILDEAQNTTPEQMKMFLTRIGFGSKAVVTGDITQIDLPSDKLSGLVQVREILKGIEGIRFQILTNRDVVRHHIVQAVVKAYEKYEERKTKKSQAD